MPSATTTNSATYPTTDSSAEPYTQLKYIDMSLPQYPWKKQRVENASHISGYMTYADLEEQTLSMKPQQEVIVIKKPLSSTDDSPVIDIIPSDHELQKLRALVNSIAIMGITLALIIPSIIIGGMSLIYGLQPQVPTGTIFPYSGNAATLLKSDDQWLFCDGSAVSRTKYSALFLVIGTIYGAGNGIDTFNLPDLRSRFLWGSSGVNDTALVSGGSASLSLTVAQLPVHSHNPGTLSTVADGVHTHTYTQTAHNHGGLTGTASHPGGTTLVTSGGAVSAYTSLSSQSHSITADNANIVIQSAGSHTHTISGATATEGQGQSIDKMPPYQTIHYVIRI